MLTWFSALLFSLPIVVLATSITQQVKKDHWKKRKSCKASVKTNTNAKATNQPKERGIKNATAQNSEHFRGLSSQSLSWHSVES